jgi:hypothetical protein
LSTEWTRGFEASVSSPSNCWTKIAGSLVWMMGLRQLLFAIHFEMCLHYYLPIYCNFVLDYMHLDFQSAFQNFITGQSSVVER